MMLSSILWCHIIWRRSLESRLQYQINQKHCKFITISITYGWLNAEKSMNTNLLFSTLLQVPNKYIFGVWANNWKFKTRNNKNSSVRKGLNSCTLMNLTSRPFKCSTFCMKRYSFRWLEHKSFMPRSSISSMHFLLP